MPGCFFNEHTTSTRFANATLWLVYRMLDFLFAFLDRVATQAGDAAQERSGMRSPLLG
jgi:hypothetical protein